MAVIVFDLERVRYEYESSSPTAEAPRVEVLSDVTCRIPGGGVVAVLGPSGCGKSTLLNLLGLLLEDWPGPDGADATGAGGSEQSPDVSAATAATRRSPSILYRGIDYRTLDRAARTRLRRSEFGYVLQSCYLLQNFTCLQNVAMPLALFGWGESERHEWARTLIETVDRRGDLIKRRHHLPRHLSLGQKQRMAVLRAVIHDPAVIFADEPTSNLDPQSTQAVLDLLESWSRGALHGSAVSRLPQDSPLRDRLDALRTRHDSTRTLILVCHQLETAKRIASHVILLDSRHRLVAEFPRSEWDRHETLIHDVLNPAQPASGNSAPITPSESPRDAGTPSRASPPDEERRGITPSDGGRSTTLREVPGQSPRFAAHFARWFARRELWTKGVRLVAAVTILAIALSAAGSLVSLVMPEAARRIDVAELDSNPFSRCLWVSGRAFDREISEERRGDLEQILKGQGAPAAVTAYHETEFELPDLPSASLLRPKGRVVTASDPLFAKLSTITAGGRSFDAADRPAVILSSRLVKKFISEDGKPPTSLRLRAPRTGEFLALDVLDVSRDPLPQGDLYYLNEAADEYLRRQDHRVGADSRITSGPPADDWPLSTDELPPKVLAAVRDWRLKLPVIVNARDFVTDDVVRHWILETEKGDDEKNSAQEWRAYLQQISDLMREAGFSASENFAVVQSQAKEPERAPPRRHYDRIIVSVDRLSDLRPVAEAIEQSGLYVNDSAIQQLQLIERMAERQRVVALAMVSLFCFGSVLSLWVMLVLRSQQKSPQIGMLRALGASDGTLRGIAAAEAAMFWFYGTVLGAAMSLACGAAACATTDVPLRLLIGSVFDPRCLAWLGIDLVASFAACLVSGLVASRRFRRLSPAISLGIGN